MKKTASAVLLVILLSSACLPTFAQKAKLLRIPADNTKPISIGKDEFVQFERIDAVSDGQGVLIRWEMRSETSNLGFYVYRVGETGLELVNEVLILGAAAKSGAPTLYGGKYEIFDSQGGLDSLYVIQSLAPGGRRVSTDPIASKYSSRARSYSSRSIELLEDNAGGPNSNAEKNYPSSTAAVKNAPMAAQADSDPVVHAWVVGQQGAKIAVRREGLHRVMRAELQAAGFNLSSNSANWRLFMQGNEQAMIVGPGDQYIEFYGRGLNTPETDLRIYYLISDVDPGKRMLTKILRPFGGHVVSNSYGAALERKEYASHMNSIQNGPAENFWGRPVTQSPTTVPFTLTGVDVSGPNAVVTVNMQGWIGSSHQVRFVLNGHDLGFLLGGGVSSYSGNIKVPSAFLLEGRNTLQLTSMNTSVSLFGSLVVEYARKYQADQNTVSFFSPGKRRIDLGGFVSPLVSTVKIFDTVQSAASIAEPVPNVPASTTPGMLRMSSTSYNGGEIGNGGGKVRVTISRVFGNTGSATVDLTLANGTAIGGAACGAGVDFVNPGIQAVALPNGVNSKFVDVVLCADGTPDSGETFTVTLSNAVGASLAQTNPRVFDISYEGNPQLITNLPIEQNGSTTSLKLASHRSAAMYGIDESYILQSPAVTINNPSALFSPPIAAQMVIVSAPDFMAAAETWAAYRRTPAGGGFTVKVVDIADVFDEFNYGASSSEVLKGFLNVARDEWQTQYVLLLGDASDDPKNYLGYGYWNYIPTKTMGMIYEEAGSDEALADFDNNGRADVAIGRIPARTTSDVTTVYNKTTAFENTPGMQSFDRGAVFAYDNPIGYVFSSDSQTLRNQLPQSMPVEMIERGAFVSSNPPQDEGHFPLLQALNSGPSGSAAGGPYIVNYSGHGSRQLWAGLGFFTILDLPQLNNANSPSIFTMMTCFSGVFFETSEDSLAEGLLKYPGGGAVATWASTTETTPDIQQQMAMRFYNQIAAGNILRIGDLFKDAKGSVTAPSDVVSSWALFGDPALQVRAAPAPPKPSPAFKPKKTTTKQLKPMKKGVR